jgi:hypothetical protein
MKKIRPFLMAVTSAFLLTACASSITMNNDDRSEAYAEYVVTEKLESLDRITSFRFNGFNSLSDENIIISTGVKRAYLITFKSTCFNLRHANFIKVNNSGSSLRVKFDSISAPQQVGMSTIDSISATQQTLATKCFIDTIHKLTLEQKKEIQKIGRKTEEEDEDKA